MNRGGSRMNWKKKIPLMVSVLLTGTLLGNTVVMAAESTATTHSNDESTLSTSTSTTSTTQNMSQSTFETSTTKSQTLTGHIIWQDHQNKMGYRPTNVLVTLLKNGKETQHVAVASKKNQWQYQFHDVKEDSDANYSVKVDALNGYQAHVSGLNVTCTLPFFDVMISTKETPSVDLKSSGKTLMTISSSQRVSLSAGYYTISGDHVSESFQVKEDGSIQQWKDGKWQTVSLIEVQKNNVDFKKPNQTTMPSVSEPTHIDWGDHDLISLLLGQTSDDMKQSGTATSATSRVDKSKKTTTSKAEKTTTSMSEHSNAVVEQKAASAIDKWLHYSAKQTVNIEGSVLWDSPIASYQPKNALVILKRDDMLYRVTEVNSENQWKYSFKDLPEKGIFHKKPYKYTLEIQFKNQRFYEVNTQNLQQITCTLPVKDVKGTIHWQDDTSKYRVVTPVLKSNRWIIPLKPTIIKHAQEWQYDFKVPAKNGSKEISYQVIFPDVAGYQKVLNGNDVTYTLQTKAVRFHCMDAKTKANVDPFAFWLEDETDSIPKLLPNTPDYQYYLQVGHIYRVRSLASNYKQTPLEIRVNPETYQVEYRQNNQWNPVGGVNIPVYYNYTKELLPPLPTFPHNPAKPHPSISGNPLQDVIKRIQGIFENFKLPSGGIELPKFPGGRLAGFSLPNLDLNNKKTNKVGSLATPSPAKIDTSHQNDSILQSALHLPQTSHQVEVGLVIVGCILAAIAIGTAFIYWRRHS